VTAVVTVAAAAVAGTQEATSVVVKGAVAALMEAEAALTEAEAVEREEGQATGTEEWWAAASVEVVGQVQAARARVMVSA